MVRSSTGPQWANSGSCCAKTSRRGREVAPGIMYYDKAAIDVTAGEAAGEYDQIRYVETELGPGRELWKTILEGYDEEGRVVHRSLADAEALRHFLEATEHLEAMGLIARRLEDALIDGR